MTPLSLLGPYKYPVIGALLLASHLAAALWYGGVVETRWEAVQAQERAEAQTVRADAISRAREAENRAAEVAITAEETHAKILADADRTAADFSSRLRRAQTRPACSNSVPGPAGPTSLSADGSAGSDGGFGQPDFESGRRLREVGKKLQADVASCWAWSATAGRKGN